jgi:protein-S-isoprenylcysteine O-methyltransferase Ste14
MNPAWFQPTPEAACFWLAYAACIVPELIGDRFQRAGAGDRRQDRGSKRVIIVGTTVSLILAFNLAVFLPGLAISGDAEAMLLAGTVLTILGVAFRWYAIRTLGRFFTRDVAIRENHVIVRNGPYRYLRHPSYSGYLLAMLGVGVALDNWAALLPLLGINLAVYANRIAIEETVLVENFGEAYRRYQQETKRIIPILF